MDPNKEKKKEKICPHCPNPVGSYNSRAHVTCGEPLCQLLQRQKKVKEWREKEKNS